MPKSKEVLSVGRLDWKEILELPARQQLRAYGSAVRFAIDNLSKAKRKPNDFDATVFAEFISNRLDAAKVSQLSRSAYVARKA